MIKAFKTDKWICSSCKRHYITQPVMLGCDMDGACACGCTSFIGSKGRVLGRKSKHWEYFFSLYNLIKNTVSEEELGIIK